MEIQQFFYWAASITAILIGVFLIIGIAIMFYLKILVRRNIEAMAAQVQDVGRTWRNLALGRFIVRVLRFIF